MGREREAAVRRRFVGRAASFRGFAASAGRVAGPCGEFLCSRLGWSRFASGPPPLAPPFLLPGPVPRLLFFLGVGATPVSPFIASAVFPLCIFRGDSAAELARPCRLCAAASLGAPLGVGFFFLAGVAFSFALCRPEVYLLGGPIVRACLCVGAMVPLFAWRWR